MLKKIAFILFLLCTVYLLFAEKPTLAILGVVTKGTEQSKGDIVYEYIMDRVNRFGLYIIVEREALNAALDELKISYSEIVDEKTAVAIGKIAGAKYILISSLLKEDTLYFLSMRVISVETSAVAKTSIKSTDSFARIEELTDSAVQYLLGTDSLESKSTPPPTPKATPAPTRTITQQPSPVKTAAPAQIKPEPDSFPSGADVAFYLSVPVTGAPVIALGDTSDTFDVGLSVATGIIFNLNLGFLTLGLGFTVGANIQKTQEDVSILYPYTLNAIPVSAYFRYMLSILPMLYIYIDMDTGISLNQVQYENPVLTQPNITGVYLEPGAGIGYRLTRVISLSVTCAAALTFYQDYTQASLIPGFQAEIRL